MSDIWGAPGAATDDARVRYLDTAARRMGATKRELAEALELQPGDRVLDIGCGVGHDLGLLAGPGARVTGVDQARPLLAVARERCRSSGITASLVAASADHLPFPACAFEAVHMERVLEHVSAGDELLQELVRVLRPDGGLALLEPDWNTLHLGPENDRVSQLIAGLLAGRHRNPSAGRTLSEFAGRVSGREVQVRQMPIDYTNFAVARRYLGVDDAIVEARAAGELDEAAAQRWAEGQERLTHEGRYHAGISRTLLVRPVRTGRGG